MHLDMIVLFVVLLGLAFAIIVIGGGLVLPKRRPQASAPVSSDNFETVLRAVEAAVPMPTPPVHDHTTASHDVLPAPEPALDPKLPDEPRGHAPAKPPEKISFSIIQQEIRAALGDLTRDALQEATTHQPSLTWKEPGRLAILALGEAAPETIWPLLQEQDIHILVVPEGHPFLLPPRAIEMLCLSDRSETSVRALAVKLRAKLAKGERVAFYAESDLAGLTAVLATRLSSRNGN